MVQPTPCRPCAGCGNPAQAAWRPHCLRSAGQDRHGMHPAPSVRSVAMAVTGHPACRGGGKAGQRIATADPLRGFPSKGTGPEPGDRFDPHLRCSAKLIRGCSSLCHGLATSRPRPGSARADPRRPCRGHLSGSSKAGKGMKLPGTGSATPAPADRAATPCAPWPATRTRRSSRSRGTLVPGCPGDGQDLGPICSTGAGLRQRRIPSPLPCQGSTEDLKPGETAAGPAPS